MLKTAPGSEQDSLISFGSSCSCIFGQGGIDVSALSWKHSPRRCREETGAKAKNGNSCKCCLAFSRKHGGSGTCLVGALEG